MTQRQKHPRSNGAAHAATSKGRAASVPFTRYAHQRPDDGNAFIPDPGDGPAHTDDDLAESLAEDYLEMATRGGEPMDELDGVVPEEMGGPFVETSAAEEFADGVDEANPVDAEQEPLPRPVAGLIALPPGDAEEDDDVEDTEEIRPAPR